MKTIPEIKISVTEEQNRLMQKMLAEVGRPEIKTVSFRFPDILVSLPFSEKEDLFLLMENDFRQFNKGRKSFVDLRISAGNKADTLDGIYDIIMKQSRISQSGRDTLLKRECSLFADYAFPRNYGRMLFNEAKRRKKKIIVAADTLYPQKITEDVLTKCGYEYNRLNVVSITKNQSVYDTVTEKSDVPPAKILHIGNDVVEDIEKPVMNGSKALLLADTVPTMIKSGRLRGYIQSQRLYDYDTEDFLLLHFAFGLYSAYMFDLPKSRVYQSDFCADPYMLGFIVFGTLKFADFQPDDFQKKIISAAGKNTEIKRGADDFAELFSAHFADIPHNFKGAELPFEFYSRHSAQLDRNMLRGFLDDDTFSEWENFVTEPKTAPVHISEARQNAAAQLADRMFPPGTKIRNIADGVLVRMKQKIKF